MAIIKNLAFFPKDVLKKLNFIEFEAISSSTTPFPFDIIHYLLPFKLKFLKESYVVTDNGKVYGLITIEKDDARKSRLKITQLFLEENSINYGELLINYVVNKFLAQGAQSFYISVSEEDTKLVTLFLDVCKFRKAGEEYYYKVKKSDFDFAREDNFSFIRFLKPQETKQISNLYNSMLASHLVPVYEKSEANFKENLFVGISNKVSFKYVLENTQTEKLFGYFTISTRNNKDFVLDVVFALGHEIYLTDVLKFARREISKRNDAWTLYVRINTCFSNHKELLNVMYSYGVEPAKKSKVLVKDMYKTLPADKTVKQIIFNDVTPAY